MPRPRVTFSRNGTTSSGASGPPNETSRTASYGDRSSGTEVTRSIMAKPANRAAHQVDGQPPDALLNRLRKVPEKGRLPDCRWLVLASAESVGLSQSAGVSRLGSAAGVSGWGQRL